MNETRPPLNIDQLQAATNHLELPRELRYFAEIASTNRYLAELPDAVGLHGLAALTEYQSAGKGRHGRSWDVPPRTSVLLSVALALPPRAKEPDMVMLAGLSVCDAIDEVLGFQTQLKWPNDVLLMHKKTCGILAQSVRRHDGSCVILGTGINVNVSREELPADAPEATSLSLSAGHAVSREDLIVGLFKRLNMWYGVLQRHPDVVFDSWKERLHTLGRPIEVRTATDCWHGIALDVRRDGGLVARAEDGKTHVVYAADVSVRH